MSDDEFDNSSLESGGYTKPFKIPTNIFDLKVKVPNCMDWTVDELHSYLLGRGLAKVIADKIIENVNKFDKKKPINVFSFL